MRPRPKPLLPPKLRALPEAERFFSEVATGELRDDLIGLVHMVVGLAPRVLLVQRIASDRREEDDPLREIALTEVAMPIWSLRCNKDLLRQTWGYSVH